MYDVVVVGAGCAGASAALLLARAGRRVLLVDRARFPRDTLSTHYIYPPGVALLARWGVLERVRQSGCPSLDHHWQEFHGVSIAGRLSAIAGAPVAYAPRRYLLDTILVEAAVAAGAELREGCSVTDLLWTDGRVVGVRHRSSSGRATTARARLVVGADGVHSTVARLVDAHAYVDQPSMTCAYYTYWSDVAVGCGPGSPLGLTGVEHHFGARRAVGAIGTNDGLTAIIAYFPQAEFRRVRRDPADAYLTAVRGAAPGLAARMAEGRREERLFGVGSQPNFFRTAFGPGWVLVGDAGHHQDSMGGWGITNAFRQADILAELLPEDPGDAVGLDGALRRFTDRRDQALRDRYHLTLQAANFEASAATLDFLRILAGKPELTAEYFAAWAGLQSMADLGRAVLRMAPEIVGGANAAV